MLFSSTAMYVLICWIYKLSFVFQCFIFHLYKGVRAGGGIGDEIEPPDGDEYEVYRILFDITFFFFVIVILLAIIQGKHLATAFAHFLCKLRCPQV
jgi:hypothetical protein